MQSQYIASRRKIIFASLRKIPRNVGPKLFQITCIVKHCDYNSGHVIDGTTIQKSAHSTHRNPILFKKVLKVYFDFVQLHISLQKDWFFSSQIF